MSVTKFRNPKRDAMMLRAVVALAVLVVVLGSGPIKLVADLRAD